MMSNTVREATYTAVIGAPGYGKSTYLSKMLDAGVRKDVLLYKTDMGINDAAFKQYRHIRSLQQFAGGKAKISDLDIEYKDMLRAVMEHFRNGALVVDDAGWFEGHSISDEFKQLLRMRRHIGLDIYYVYHGLTDVPIAHFPFTNNIILFHTTDNAEYKIKKLPQGGDRLLKARDALAKMAANGVKYQPIIIKLA